MLMVSTRQNADFLWLSQFTRGYGPEATRAQNKAATVQRFFPADAILGAKCFHPLIYLAAWRHLPGP